MSTQRTSTLRFLPYPFEPSALPMSVEAVRVDGRDAQGRLNGDQHVIDMSSDPSWRSMQLRLHVTFDPALPRRLLPEQELSAPPIALQARLRCKKARLRRTIAFEVHDWSLGLATHEVELHRDELRHELEITPMLVRTRPGLPGASSHAWQPMARLAEGRPWVVRVDKAPVGNRQNLQIVFRDFAEMEQTRAHPDGLYYLDCEDPDPILYLNSHDQDVVSALKAQGTSGPLARIRDVLFAQIQVAVWQQLFAHAAAHLRDGEAEKSWQRGVLEHWLPQLMPELADHESRIAELSARSSPEERAELLRRLDSLLQSRIKYSTSARKALGELQR